MAYNLYQAQMAKAWAQRVEKEQLIADRFWSKHAKEHKGKNTEMDLPMMRGNLKDIETCSSIAPTYVSDVASSSPDVELLKDRLERLEQELLNERRKRLEIEEDLNRLKSKNKVEEDDNL